MFAVLRIIHFNWLYGHNSLARGVIAVENRGRCVVFFGARVTSREVGPLRPSEEPPQEAGRRPGPPQEKGFYSPAKRAVKTL